MQSNTALPIMLLTTAEVATLLRLKETTVTAWCRDGVLPALKVGDQWRVDQSDLINYLEQRKTQSNA